MYTVLPDQHAVCVSRSLRPVLSSRATSFRHVRSRRQRRLRANLKKVHHTAEKSSESHQLVVPQALGPVLGGQGGSYPGHAEPAAEEIARQREGQPLAPPESRWGRDAAKDAADKLERKASEAAESARAAAAGMADRARDVGGEADSAEKSTGSTAGDRASNATERAADGLKVAAAVVRDAAGMAADDAKAAGEEAALAARDAIDGATSAARRTADKTAAAAKGAADRAASAIDSAAKQARNGARSAGQNAQQAAKSATPKGRPSGGAPQRKASAEESPGAADAAAALEQQGGRLNPAAEEMLRQLRGEPFATSGWGRRWSVLFIKSMHQIRRVRRILQLRICESGLHLRLGLQKEKIAYRSLTSVL